MFRLPDFSHQLEHNDRTRAACEATIGTTTWDDADAPELEYNDQELGAGLSWELLAAVDEYREGILSGRITSAP
jgi:hypothetical protein